MSSDERAQPKDPTGSSYQLGDLDIAPRPKPRGPRPGPSARRALAEAPELALEPATNLPRTTPANTQGGPPRAGQKPERGLGRATSVDLDGDSDAGFSFELDTAPVSPVRGQGVPQAAAFDFGTRDLGDGLDDVDTSAAPDLDVDVAPPPRAARAERPQAPEPPKAQPSGTAQKEDTELPEFGDRPTSLVGCVPYAVRVATRLLALHGERKRIAEQVERLRAEHHAALSAMGQALMALGTDPRLAPLRDKVARVHDATAERSRADQGVSQARAEHQAAMAALEREAEQLKQALSPYLEAERAAEQAHKKADENLKRGQAHQRRVELELRALSEAVNVDPSRTAELKVQLEDKKQIVASLQQAMEQATAALGEARRELALRRGSLDALEDRKQQLLAQARAREADAQHMAQAAEGTYTAALRALAEAAREQNLSHLASAQLTAVEDLEGVLKEAEGALERNARARTLYHRPSVIKGVLLVLTMIALAIVALKMHS